MIHGHGNDIHRNGSFVAADFSTNVASREPHPALLVFLREKLNVIANYPDSDAQQLREKLAYRHGLTRQALLVTNGSTEAFYLVAAAFRGACSLVYTPSFSEYEDACLMHRHQLQFRPNRHWNEPVGDGYDLVWLANPNNPDGKLSSPQSIRNHLEHNPQTIFVVDEAYAGLCRGFESLIHWVSEYDNLIVVRSMTKLYAMPGLRLGYLAASPALIARIQQWRMPWSVNALALEAGKFILENESDLAPDVPALLRESERMQTDMAFCAEWDVLPSACNYFLVKLKRKNAANLKAFLLNEKGFLIRDASNFRGLDERFFRIAAQTEELNAGLLDAMKRWINL